MTTQEAIDELIIVRNVYDGMREAYKPCVEAIDMAISALQAQEAKTQLSAEGTTSNLISRQDAIEAVSESLKRVFPEHRQIAEKCLNVLPSAQPEPCVDTIDALDESIKHFDDMAEECRRNANIERNDYMDMRDDAAEYRQLSIWLNELKWLRERFQSQPEQLTDKEQRIFLAAMGREEKVCKQVDDECRNCREPYEDSLVRTCHEITRKVKGALWMI